MASHTITITVSNGKLDYGTDDPLIVAPGDRLRWYCDEAFTVIFSMGNSPFYPDRSVSSARAQHNSSYGNIRNPNAFPALYKYTVVVFDGNDQIVDDPIIIIDDDGGGGPGARGGRGGPKRK